MRTRSIVLAVVALLLVVSACTTPDTPQTDATRSPLAAGSSDPSQSPASGDPATGQPSGDRSGGDGGAPDDAQALLDDAMAALAQAPSVEVMARRTLAMNGPDPVDQTMRAAWWPQNQAWIGVTTVFFGRKVIRTQVLVVDGRTYIRSRTSGGDITGNWLAVNKSSDGAGSAVGDQTVDWDFDELTSSIVASNASTSGETTTIIGRIPTGLAIGAFGITGDELLPSVRDELSDGTTLVTVTVVDGFPRELSILGRDVQLPDQGIPQLSIDVLGRRFFVMRLAPGDQRRAPQAPPPSQVDTLKDVTINPDS